MMLLEFLEIAQRGLWADVGDVVDAKGFWNTNTLVVASDLLLGVSREFSCHYMVWSLDERYAFEIMLES
jgi:hypothetical protein